jgi:quercetin dioxygenase-like cupin family protein
MGNFHNLNEALTAMAEAAQPSVPTVKGLVVGETVMAGLLRTDKSAVGLHRQPNHEELLIVLEGEAEFRGGDEVRHVRPGDFVFVPRDTVHGTVAGAHAPVCFLSVMAPRIDLAKDVAWEDKPPAFHIV